MSYQNVGTPRFYIDHINFQRMVGLIKDSNTIIDHLSNSLISGGLRNPMPIEFSPDGNFTNISVKVPIFNEPAGFGLEEDFFFNNNQRYLGMDKLNWCAVLGHNLASQGVDFNITFYDNWNDHNEIYEFDNIVSLINDNEYDGFQIYVNGANSDDFEPLSVGGSEPHYTHFRFNFTPKSGNVINAFRVGSLCAGKYYDMPVSPNLSLSLKREYEGINKIQTYNGGYITNAIGTSPPAWGSLPQWTLGDSFTSTENFSSGRRVWDLSFSYVSDSDMFSSNEMISLKNNFTTTGLNDTDFTGDYIWNNSTVNFSNTDYTEVADISTQGITVKHVTGAVSNCHSGGVQIAKDQKYFIEFDINFTEGSTYPRLKLVRSANSNSASAQYEGYINVGDHTTNNHFSHSVIANKTEGAAAVRFKHDSNYDTAKFTISNFVMYIKAEGENEPGFNYNLFTDDSFFSQVWQKTLGGALPFIFQPDKSNSNPDQFAIARFRDNSLKVKRSAFNVYDVSIVIEEVW